MHRLDLSLYSHPKEFWGNGERTYVNSKGKIPSSRKILLRRGSNPHCCIMQDSKPNTLLTELFWHPTTVQHPSLLSGFPNGRIIMSKWGVDQVGPPTEFKHDYCLFFLFLSTWPPSLWVLLRRHTGSCSRTVHMVESNLDRSVWNLLHESSGAHPSHAVNLFYPSYANNKRQSAIAPHWNTQPGLIGFFFAVSTQVLNTWLLHQIPWCNPSSLYTYEFPSGLSYTRCLVYIGLFQTLHAQRKSKSKAGLNAVLPAEKQTTISKTESSRS